MNTNLGFHMITKLGFHKINKEYTNYLIEQDLKIADILLDPCVYFGPVFEKESANGKRLKFYAPCCTPSKWDFEHDPECKKNGLSEQQCRTQIAEDCYYSYYRHPLLCDSWTAENEYYVAMVLKLADMIPVPDDMIEDFDLWNDVKVPDGKTPEEAEEYHKTMYARFKCIEDDILSNSLANVFVMEDCIDFYRNHIRLDIGIYNPYRCDTKDFADIEVRNLTMGLPGNKAEIACVLFDSREYKQNKKFFSAKVKLMGKKVRDELDLITREEQYEYYEEIPDLEGV